MLPTIDLKAPPREDLPCEEAAHRIGAAAPLRSSAGQIDASGYAYSGYVASFREIVPATAATPRPRPAPVAENAMVLVADDFDTNRRTVARTLKLQGHAVSTAENGRQALALLRERSFELVLLDIMMPEMDG